jgi:hypothetical protein
VGPNDVELVRVFPKEESAAIADITFPVNDDFDLVVEAEAGQTIFNAGAQFRVFILLRDVSANTNIALAPKGGTNTPNVGANANMATNAWPALLRRFEYSVQAAALAGRANHVCQAIAFLTVGAAGDRDTSFAVSPYFMLTD